MRRRPKRLLHAEEQNMEAMAGVPDGSLDGYPWPLALRLPPTVRLSEDEYFELCQINRELWIERTADGRLEILPLVGGLTGMRNADITMQLCNWAKDDGTGTAVGPSVGFRLPNTAVRSPDAAWVPQSRLARLSRKEWQQFPPLCPDFVLELRSNWDSLSVLQAKMEEYLANGARLGWLLDPRSRRVYVYRPGVPVERLDNPRTIAGDPVLPGFVLDLREIWDPLADVRSK
jgi:Uma2 family endonuclease